MESVRKWIRICIAGQHHEFHGLFRELVEYEMNANFSVTSFEVSKCFKCFMEKLTDKSNLLGAQITKEIVTASLYIYCSAHEVGFW